MRYLAREIYDIINPLPSQRGRSSRLTPIAKHASALARAEAPVYRQFRVAEDQPSMKHGASCRARKIDSE